MRKIVANAALAAVTHRELGSRPTAPRGQKHQPGDQWRPVLDKPLLTIALALIFGTAGSSQGPPPDLLELETHGYKWISASAAFGPDGLPDPNLQSGLRQALERKIEFFDRRFGSARAHGQQEGELPTKADEPLCPLMPIPGWPPSEAADDFDAALLLSEVAATATVAEVTLGFSAGGPAAWLSLTDAIPLHDHSPIPQYAVVPLGNLVIGDRVLCSYNTGPTGRGKYRPRAGSRIVLMGSRGDQSTVFLTPEKTGALATVQDGGALSWKFRLSGSPESTAELKATVARLDADGLFELTLALAREKSPSTSRVKFGHAWAAMRSDGCDQEVADTDSWLAALCRLAE